MQNGAPDGLYFMAAEGILETVRAASTSGQVALLKAGADDMAALADKALTPEQESVATSGLAQCCACSANHAIIVGDHAEAFRFIRAAWEGLEAHALKRAEYQLEPRPSTIARTAVLSALSALKWRGDEAYANEILTPHQTVSRWLALGNSVKEKLRTSRMEPTSRQYIALVEGQMFCGLQVCACAWRYERFGSPLVISEWNGWLDYLPCSEPLNDMIGHWRQVNPLPLHPWYWRFEVAKSWLSRRERGARIRRALFRELAGRLLESMRNAGNDSFAIRRCAVWLDEMCSALPEEPQLSPAS